MTTVEVTPEATEDAEKAFRVEQHGIDFIPVAERWAKPRDLFGMWAGASFQIEYFVYGVILMTFGLSFAQAVWITIVGNLSFVLLGLTSLQGPEAGTTTMTINRASFGPLGSRVIALFNWGTQVGFETEGLILLVFAGEVLMEKAGFLPGTPAKVLLILTGVAIQLLLPFFGHASVVKTLRVLILPFIVLFAILAGLALSKVNLSSFSHAGSWQVVMEGLAFTIALSGLGWTENGNDYSRYLPPGSSKKSIVTWIVLGTAVPEILVMLLGVAVGTFASAIGTNQNPFTAFIGPHPVVSTWFVVPFVVVSILQLFAINSLDLYSSGVTLQAIGLNIRRWQAVLVDTAIACGLTFYAIFSSSFFSLLKDFVIGVICWIGPWMAIYLVDWLLRHRRYVPGELQKTGSDSLYWRSGGIHWPAIVAQTVGTVLAVESIAQVFFVGQISRWIGPDAHGYYADFSIYIGITAAALVYYVLARPGVRREAERQRDLLAS